MIEQDGALQAKPARNTSLLGQVVWLTCLVNLFAGMFAMQANAAGADRPIRLVAFGDSLTAGYMLPQSKSFPAQLEAALKAKGYAVEMTNAGVSGDTSGEGLARFDWAVPDGTDAVILELGANDALRGLPPKTALSNLDKIIERLRARNIDVLLAGMLSPSNWGADYERDFNAIYPDLAKRYGLVLYPFFLDGVIGHRSLSLEDGLHPSAKGIAVIVDRIMPAVEELLKRVGERPRAASRS